MKNLIIYTLVGLSLFLIFQLHQSKQSTRHLTEEISYYTDSLHTYTSLYPSASFNSLKRENKELYNEVKRLKDLKEVIKYKYRTEYRTDTIYISNPSDEVINKDTTYRLSNETDSISYSLLANVTGKLNYYKLYFKLSDTFKITRQEDNRFNRLNISSDNGRIEGVTRWQKRTPRLNVGLNAGIGYGILSKRPDLFVGVGFCFNFF
jgi:hypothetical protein|nr:MAG TPA: hypothetical protein [Caudoviricetes sp.]